MWPLLRARGLVLVSLVLAGCDCLAKPPGLVQRYESLSPAAKVAPPPLDLKLSIASYDELAEASVLLVSSFFTTEPSESAIVLAHREHMRLCSNHGPFDGHVQVVARRRSGDLVGFVDLDMRPKEPIEANPRPYISDLAVRPDCRRMRVATRLMEYAERVARRRWGCDNLYLKVETANEVALVMYEKMGYVAGPPVEDARSAKCVMTKVHAAPIQHTSRPVVTGSSVLGIKYKGGVMLAADTLASYGSLAMFKDVRRITKCGACTLVGGSGEMSDYAEVVRKLAALERENANHNDGFSHAPADIYAYVRAVMYERRNSFDPLWNSLVIGGFKDGAAFLGTVDLLGTAFTDDIIATGYGAHLAMPIMRNKWRPDLDEGEARAILEDCLRILFYRDCRALDTVQISKATAEGTLVSEPYKLPTDWTSASFVAPKAGADGDGGW
ncbi:nucleophile aminohydrolase [Pelagophyceae sp. CCMP2097]|nr:nucleophile aminohydrolase [Pelagophyceae sp. CCMP2097]